MGFLEELKRRDAERSVGIVGGKRGPSVLIFGCRSSDSDFLYHSRLKDFVSSGTISKLLLGFSRQPGTRKRYVQDVICQNSSQLRALLSHPKCHVFVCGSSNMAQEVARAFREVLGESSLDALVQESRYHEDVFGLKEAPKLPKKSKAAITVNILFQQTGEAFKAALLAAIVGDDFDINSVTKERSSSLLHLSCQAGDSNKISTLLELGCDINAPDSLGRTPLFFVKDAVLVNFLMSKGASLVSKLHSLFYPCHAAVLAGDLDKLKLLLDQGRILDEADFNGITPLHVAIVRGDEAAVKELIRRGADLCSATRRGLLPLALALSLEVTLIHIIFNPFPP
jgi:hypothetical protein